MRAVFGEDSKDPDGFDPTKLLVITTDGKGVRVVEEDLREATRKAAEKARNQRKRGNLMEEQIPRRKSQKRMGQVCAVYTVAPFPRTPEDIIRDLRHLQPVSPATTAIRPQPEDKRIWASVVREPREVIEEGFIEALRRDPHRRMRWTVVIDGDDKQRKTVLECVAKYNPEAIVVLDFIHLASNLWEAARVFHPGGSAKAGDTKAGEWVDAKLLAILRGEAANVAAGMRRSATLRRIRGKRREPVDKCAGYILNHKDMLCYDRCLAEGLPIGSGVAESTCRHLMKSRLDRSAAPWTLEGAEAVLKLRALSLCGDFDEYWRFHEQREFERNHLSRFQNGTLPPARTIPRQVK